MTGFLLIVGLVPASASHDDTLRASVSSGGTQATGGSYLPSISVDGDHVAFTSWAQDLVVGDTNGSEDVFVHDRRTGTTTRVSVASGGGQANGASLMPAISSDGRYIAFYSDASNLIPGDTNGALDVFVHDRTTNTTSRVSVGPAGTQAVGGDSHSPAISGDGRYVAFLSGATNLVAGDVNATTDVFVHDRQTETTTVIAATATGQPGHPDHRPAISADGRYVAFTSPADDLVPGDTNGTWDVFVHDRTASITTRVSVASGGAQATGGDSDSPSISGDGRYIVFDSFAADLVSNDTNGNRDVFVHERGRNETYRISVPTGGGQANGGHSGDPTISTDGRFIAFTSHATDLAPDDTNGTSDVFVHDRQELTTTLVTTGIGGQQSNGQITSVLGVSGDGRLLTFSSWATNLVANDTNGRDDVFVKQLDRPGLLRLFGPNRYATAAGVSREAHPFGADTVYVAVGTNFPDALGAGPAAAARNAPLLLVQTDSIPPETAEELLRLDPAEIVVVGGPAVISAAVESQLGGYADTVTRIAGPNRYATASAIVAHTWSRPGAPTIFVAVGTNFPDALGAGPAAARAEAPLLLVQTEAVPPETAEELARHNPSQIVIVGGPAVISPAVEAQLGAYADDVIRLDGTNRYGTAAAIVASGWPGTAETVYIAVGTNFPDALGAGPAAAHRDSPLLLVQTDSVPNETKAELERLDPSRIIIVGGNSVVSVDVEVTLSSYVP